MSVASNLGPATLQFVARRVVGDIMSTKTIFDNKERINVKKEVKIIDPVIVFFPNGASQVLDVKSADAKGYLAQPEILNFEAVTDTKSIAGKYKYAMSIEHKKDFWTQMEFAVIQTCIARTGNPLSGDCDFSRDSILFETDAATESRK